VASETGTRRWKADEEGYYYYNREDVYTICIRKKEMKDEQGIYEGIL
jgi:hypothetical protein